jgi:hypothetical protein
MDGWVARHDAALYVLSLFGAVPNVRYVDPEMDAADAEVCRLFRERLEELRTYELARRRAA